MAAKMVIRKWLEIQKAVFLNKTCTNHQLVLDSTQACVNHRRGVELSKAQTLGLARKTCHGL